MQNFLFLSFFIFSSSVHAQIKDNKFVPKLLSEEVINPSGITINEQNLRASENINNNDFFKYPTIESLTSRFQDLYGNDLEVDPNKYYVLVISKLSLSIARLLDKQIEISFYSNTLNSLYGKTGVLQSENTQPNSELLTESERKYNSVENQLFTDLEVLLKDRNAYKNWENKNSIEQNLALKKIDAIVNIVLFNLTHNFTSIDQNDFESNASSFFDLSSYGLMSKSKENVHRPYLVQYQRLADLFVRYLNPEERSSLYKETLNQIVGAYNYKTTIEYPSVFQKSEINYSDFRFLSYFYESLPFTQRVKPETESYREKELMDINLSLWINLYKDLSSEGVKLDLFIRTLLVMSLDARQVILLTQSDTKGSKYLHLRSFLENKLDGPDQFDYKAKAEAKEVIAKIRKWNHSSQRKSQQELELIIGSNCKTYL